MIPVPASLRLARVAALVLALLPRAIAGGSGELAPYREWHLFSSADGLPHASVRALCRFRDQLWVGTDGGLALREGERWTAWTRADGLPCEAISAIDVDPLTHDVWVGTWGGGLLRFSAGRFERFDQFTSGLAGDLVFALRVVGPRVWVANNGGLSVFDWASGRWELLLERRAGGPEAVVRSVVEVRGQACVGAWNDTVWQARESGPSHDRRTTLLDAGPAGAGGTLAGLAAARGELWVRSATRLWRGGDEDWREMELPVLAAGTWSVFDVSPSGRAWLGTDAGLATPADGESGRWLCYDFPASAEPGPLCIRSLCGGRETGREIVPSVPAPGWLRCLHVTDDEVWVGSSRGLLRGRSGEPSAAVPVAARLAPAADGPGVLGLGVLGPFRRTVSLPGTGTASPGARVDDLAAEFAEAQLAQVGSRPRVHVQKELPGLSPYAWGLPEDEILVLLRRRAPLALLGCFAPFERVACAVSRVEEVPCMNTSLAAPSADELASGWIFRCPAHDPREQAALLDRAFESLRCSRPVVVRSGDRWQDLHLEWWRERAEARGTPVLAEFDLPRSAQGWTTLVAGLRSLRFDVLMACTDAGEGAGLVRRLREVGFEQAILLGDSALDARFLDAAGPRPGRVLAPLPCAHRLDPEPSARFAASRQDTDPARPASTGPSLEAWASYEATRHVIDAIREGATEREALRRTLAERSRARLARLVDGRWLSLDDDD